MNRIHQAGTQGENCGKEQYITTTTIIRIPDL